MLPEDLPDLGAMRYARYYQHIEYNPHTHMLLTDRPFVIFALLLDRTLGDFIFRNLFAATVKRRFRNARLIAYYRPDRPYKEAVVKLNPHIATTWRLSGSTPLPMDYFDVMGSPPIQAGTKRWYETQSAEPDLVLTPSMMNFEFLGSLGPIARFKVPNSLVDPLHARLIEVGLREDQWFCVLHYRERGYQDEWARPNRDMRTPDAIDVIKYVTRELGGQVVRIGHPSMERIAPMPGFVDLTGAQDDLMTHAYAVSRARFFLELSPSGPMALAGAFGVPLARCNAVSLLGPLEAPSFALMQHLVGPGGTRVPKAIAIAKGLYSELAVKDVIERYGYRFERNSDAELRAAARDIAERTRDCQTWREPSLVDAGAPVDAFSLPLERPPEIEIVEYPDAMPKFD
jgi:putative glycosyltransferase (TIGR04372 family)